MRAIFFDLDDTLLRFIRPYENLLADAFRDVHGEVEASWLETYDASFFDALEAMDPDPYRRAFRATGHDPDPLVDALWERELSACEPPAGAEADLRRLSESHRLGVLTNGITEWQRAKLAASGLERFFDAVVAPRRPRTPPGQACGRRPRRRRLRRRRTARGRWLPVWRAATP